MKTFHWPLVLIGATLMIIGPALPWFRTYYSYVFPGSPTSGYITGFGGVGLVSALGGVVLLITLLFEGSESDGHRPLMISALFGFLIAGAACLGLQPLLAEPQTFSPAFGLFVSVFGVALGLIGGQIRVAPVAINDKISFVVLVVLELLIITCVFTLVAYPAVGVSLGVWETPKRYFLCLKGIGDSTSQSTEQQYDQCVATAVAEATRPSDTLEPWWNDWGH